MVAWKDFVMVELLVLKWAEAKVSSLGCTMAIKLVDDLVYKSGILSEIQSAEKLDQM